MTIKFQFIELTRFTGHCEHRKVRGNPLDIACVFKMGIPTTSLRTGLGMTDERQLDKPEFERDVKL